MRLRLPQWAILLPILAISAGCAPRSTLSSLSHGTRAPDTAGIQFRNTAAASGIHFRWPRQPRPLRNVDSFGCGCAFLDYDNDGWQDVILVGTPHPGLFRNKRNGQFEDVTSSAGLSSIRGPWTGVAVGDYDGDGFLDLLLTGYHRLALLRNHGGKRFEDVTRAAGLDPGNRGHWGASAGFMDLDGSGRLALVLTNYVVFGPGERQFCEFVPGIRSGCPPRVYRSEFPELWKNLGAGRFKDETSSSGMKSTHGSGLVVAFADVDDHGLMDFFIGNDGQPADLMRNLGHLHFSNRGAPSGVAYGRIHDALAAMGADWGDYDRDGRLDLVVSAFSDEPYSLLHNLGRGIFEYASDTTGISEPTFKPLGFGAKWIDADNDGWPDIVFANGHVYDNVGQTRPGHTFRQPLMLFHNQHGRHFQDIAPTLGGDMARPILGRGLAVGDYDNDGREDMLVVDYEGEPQLLHNLSTTSNHWITLDLRAKLPNSFAYGARITARSGSEVWVGQVSPASSYLSSSDPRVHFGLGQTRMLDTISIRWPDGRRNTLRHVSVDQILRVRE